MVSNTHWIGIGAVSAGLVGLLAVGCAKQTSNPDNISGTPATSVNSTTVLPQTNTSTTNASSSMTTANGFADASKTWTRIEGARGELDNAMKARNLDQVHESCAKILDLVKTLPYDSSTLPEDKRTSLNGQVKDVADLAGMMQSISDTSDMTSAQEHQAAINVALDAIKGIYPAESMRSSVPMKDANTSGNAMGPEGKPVDPGQMSGMGDQMGGMGKPSDPTAMSGMGGMAKPGGPGSMAGMGMMDKMTSGMSAPDQSEMKMVMDKMAAMPPAARKQAMQKMSGADVPADPGQMSGDM